MFYNLVGQQNDKVASDHAEEFMRQSEDPGIRMQLASDRASLINDAYISLVESDYAGMIKFLGREQHFMPWDTVLYKFVTVSTPLRWSSTTYPLLHYDRLDWVDERHYAEEMNILGLVSLQDE